jgi:hypothetical protein
VVAAKERRGDHADLMPAHDTAGRATHLAVTHHLRRAHDDSVISAHCGLRCAQQALEELTRGQMMGTDPPGPLQWVEAQLVDLTSGGVCMFTRGLVPLGGRPPAEVHTWP